MGKWISVGKTLINLDHIITIEPDANRWNVETQVLDPCVVFQTTAFFVHGSGANEELLFFGRERESLLSWLSWNPLGIDPVDQVPGSE